MSREWFDRRCTMNLRNKLPDDIIFLKVLGDGEINGITF